MIERSDIKIPRFVTPEGSLIMQTSKSGLLMGNRGTLGPKHYSLPQPHAPNKPWITCLLKENGKPLPKVDVKYTRLFFLDEVTAFAAGHRPCRQYQFQRYDLFDKMWTKAFGKKAPHFDDALHCDRCHEDGTKRIFSSPLAELPSGVMVKLNEGGQPHLLLMGKLFPWSMNGYCKPITISDNAIVDVVTPVSLVEMFRLGFPLLVNREETIHQSIFKYL